MGIRSASCQLSGAQRSSGHPTDEQFYGVATVDGTSRLNALDLATGRVSIVADYGTRLLLHEFINDSLQFMLAPGGRSFVTTSTEAASTCGC
jgi:hypothetical protein